MSVRASVAGSASLLQPRETTTKHHVPCGLHEPTAPNVLRWTATAAGQFDIWPSTTSTDAKTRNQTHGVGFQCPAPDPRNGQRRPSQPSLDPCKSGFLRGWEGSGPRVFDLLSLSSARACWRGVSRLCAVPSAFGPHQRRQAISRKITSVPASPADSKPPSSRSEGRAGRANDDE